MNDLGFGIVDRRSVLVVLFILGLSKLLLGYDIPIDTSNFLTAFIGLLVLTGFIYATRSIMRLALTMCVFIIRIPIDFVVGFINRDKKMRGLRGAVLVSIGSLKDSFLLGFFYPSFLQREWKSGEFYGRYSSLNIQLGILGAIDRIFLISIAFSTTVPSLANELRTIGFWGILVMLFVYVITGTFSFILDDAILKGELQQKEAIQAARYPNINFPTSITAYPPSRDYGD